MQVSDDLAVEFDKLLHGRNRAKSFVQLLWATDNVSFKYETVYFVMNVRFPFPSLPRICSPTISRAVAQLHSHSAEASRAPARRAISASRCASSVVSIAAMKTGHANRISVPLSCWCLCCFGGQEEDEDGGLHHHSVALTQA